MQVRRTSGPDKPRTSNPPKMPKMPADLGELAEVVPTLGAIAVGGGIGVIEALAEVGVLAQWRDLDAHWKALAYAGIAAACGFLVGMRKADRASAKSAAERAELDAEIEALIEARGAAYAIAILYGVRAGFQAMPAEWFAPDAAATLPADPNEGGVNQGWGGLNALISDDVRPALDELLAHRRMVEDRQVSGFNITASTPASAVGGFSFFNLERA